MSDSLTALVQREQLHCAQVYYFESFDRARALWQGLQAEGVPLPLQCAVALLHGSDVHAVAMFIGRSFRIHEMPKPVDESWSWNDYPGTLGLQRHDEWKGWSSEEFRGVEPITGGRTIVDWFASESLKRGRYACRACGEEFDTYDRLFDGHVYSVSSKSTGHDRAFNQAVLKLLGEEVVATGPTEQQALTIARMAVPAGARVISESTTPGRSERSFVTGKGATEAEAIADAGRAADKHMNPDAVREEPLVSGKAVSEWKDFSFETLARSLSDREIAEMVRDRLNSERYHGASWSEISVPAIERTKSSSNGFLGLGKRPAIVRARIEIPWRVEVHATRHFPATARVRYKV